MISEKDIFRKLLYFWNYLEFSKTVWDAKSKNIKYDFARILGMKAAQIYTYIVAEYTVLFVLKRAVKDLLWPECPKYDIGVKERVIWNGLNTKKSIAEHKNWHKRSFTALFNTKNTVYSATIYVYICAAFMPNIWAKSYLMFLLFASQTVLENSK